VTPRFTVLIPARYRATRFPGKPLHVLAGKPMIQHVTERARASGATRVVVATDDTRIRDACLSFGAEVCMTSAEHPSGTDRLAEAAKTLGLAGEEIVVNLQGDEPLMPPVAIAQVAGNLHARPEASIATLCAPISAATELFSRNVVKVVMDKAGYASYFSRAPIPWARDALAARPQDLPADVAYFRHLGLYAYRAGFLAEFVQWPPAPTERAEALEQLRALWNGRRIHVEVARDIPPPGVDTPEDSIAAERALLQLSS
jgi:3-deoxy-manno-octulosonate cytidylyltransferase (CMP-KDO synthetase)